MCGHFRWWWGGGGAVGPWGRAHDCSLDEGDSSSDSAYSARRLFLFLHEASLKNHCGLLACDNYVTSNAETSGSI